MSRLSLVAACLVLFSNTIQAQEKQACGAKERFNDSYRVHNDKGLKSTANYDVNYYKLDLKIENNVTYIEGVGTIGARSLTQISAMEFELHNNYFIDSILLGVAKKTFSRNSTGVVSVNVGAPIAANTPFYIRVYYRGTAPTGGGAAIGDGFSTGTSPTWGNSVTWSLSEPYAAYEWFPVKQSLSDKADSSEVWITTSATNLAGSNGVLENITILPSGKKRYEWKSRYPISYYLISVTVAEYVDYTIYAKPKGLNDSIKVVNYIYNNPQTLPYFKAEIDKTADMIEVFSEKFGLYPFHKEKYGHCMAPFGGGMEHQTMTSQGSFHTDLTSHELAHQWFGDNVTCKSWKDIWVNEGFASYAEYVFLQNWDTSLTSTWLTDTENSALNSPTGSVYVDDTTKVGRIFSSSLSYNKGAFLLHMLRFEMDNDSLFFEGMKEYSRLYGNSNATGMDFKKVMENTAGMNLDQFFNQWYFGEGFPLYNINWNQDKYGNLDMIIDQVVSASSVTPLFVMDLELSVSRLADPDTMIRLYIDQTKKEVIVPHVAGKITGITVDPNNWVLNAEGVVLKNPTIDLGTDLIEEEIPYFDVFPNPATESITISARQVLQSARILVYDSKGCIVLERKKIFGKVIRLNVSDLIPGIYVVEVRDGNYSDKQEVVISK